MEYKIGQLLTEHIKKEIEVNDTSFRRYAIDKGMCDNDLTQIRMGHKAASGKKLSQVIDIELLREPLIEEIKTLLDELDTDTIISAYNIIYSKERKK